MNILVTGATGCLGKKVVESIGFAHNILGLSRKPKTQKNIVACDLLDSIEIYNVLREFVPDIVIHCAGAANPNEECYTQNILYSYNLASALKDMYKNVKFINISSILVYGNIINEYIDETSNPCPQTLYALSKIHSEELIDNLLEDVWHLRCATIASKNPSHGMLYDVFRKAEFANKTHSQLKVFGKKPGSYKPYIHIDDVCKFIYDAIEDKSKKYRRIRNLCAFGSVSVKDVVYNIRKLQPNISKIIWEDNNNDQYILCNTIFNNDWMKYKTSKEVIQKVCEERFS